MFADLHLHTNFSDGTFSPEELVANAVKQKLCAIALTDHDTLEGCERAAAACATAGIEFIAGSELTAEQDDHEIHILGYFLDGQNKSSSQKPASSNSSARIAFVRWSRASTS